MKKAVGDVKRDAGVRRGVKRLRVPPPESELWPQQYRGERWKPIYAHLFMGRCQFCVYSCPPPRSQQLLDKWLRQTPTLLCTNHPASPGKLRQVLPTETCRNFRAKRWKTPPLHPASPDNGRRSGKHGSEPDGDVRRIPLGHGLFAIVDAADYEELSKYKWFASRQGRDVYARCHIKGRTVLMHRLIMQAPAGCPVDHIDHNSLNNRRSNLRVCTQGQNCVNARPRGGSSRFVGVTRRGERWVAQISNRGEHFYLGLYDDEIEAAKVRDRKAYELNGEFAYINLPEELARWLKQQHRHGVCGGKRSGRSRAAKIGTRRDTKARRKP
jgi:hypothetical protein